MYRLILLLLLLSTTLHAQDSLLAFAPPLPLPDDRATDKTKPGHDPSGAYFLNYPVDAPIILAGTAWSAYAFGPIYSKEESTPDQIAALDKNDLSSFDRWATKYYSAEADANSNYIFYGSIPLPIVLMLDKRIRPDALKVYALYWEAMAITGTLYTAGDYFVDRYRPLAYNPDAPMDQKTAGVAKNSFFAGHPALVATTTFFTAAIYAHYHKDSWTKWLAYGGAAAATGITIYYRLIAGRHFPSDIVVGTLIGVGSGLLTPYLHQNKNWTNSHIGVAPMMRTDGVHGLTLAYRF